MRESVKQRINHYIVLLYNEIKENNNNKNDC